MDGALTANHLATQVLSVTSSVDSALRANHLAIQALILQLSFNLGSWLQLMRWSEMTTRMWTLKASMMTSLRMTSSGVRLKRYTTQEKRPTRNMQKNMLTRQSTKEKRATRNMQKNMSTRV